MPAFHCPSCGKAFQVPDAQAGVARRCMACGGELTIPSVGTDVAAIAATDGVLGSADVEMVATNAAGEVKVDPSHAIGLPARRLPRVDPLVEGRPFNGIDEVARRRRNIFLIGAMLAVGFLMPVLIPEIKGQFEWKLSFASIERLFDSTSTPWEKVMLVYPLAAGLGTMILAAAALPRLRGTVMMVLSIAPIVALFLEPDFKAAWQLYGPDVMDAGVISALLLLLGLGGVFIGSRTRFYRPSQTHAFLIGAIGGLAATIFWIIPIDGRPPIATPVEMFMTSIIGGIGAVIAVGLLIVSCVICLINTPNQHPARASKLGAVAFRCLCGFVVILPTTFTVVVAVEVFQFEGELFLVAGVVMGMAKAIAWLGGLLLLLPTGLTDVLIGQPVTDPNGCAACGYDLRASEDRVCPECGHRNR